jgi:hypothetical protein
MEGGGGLVESLASNLNSNIHVSIMSIVNDVSTMAVSAAATRAVLFSNIDCE